MKKVQLVLGLIAVSLALSCGGSSPTSPSGSSASVCGEVSLSATPQAFFIRGCSSISQSIANIQYVGSSSVVSSYSFDATCTATGKRYTGSVNAQARTATVNGASCTF